MAPFSKFYIFTAKFGLVFVLAILTWKNCVSFNSVQEWLVDCFWPLWYVYTIKFYYALYYHVLRVQVFEKCDSSKIGKMNCCSFQQDLQQNLGWFLSEHWKTLSFSKRTERAQVLLKNGTRDFQNSPPFERSACFYVIITENFKRFQYFDFETDFLESEKLFQKTGILFFSWKH